MNAFDLVVIGGGSAGLKAARTAARTGRKVALAEERELGGECFWAGCVPTKAMVRAAQVWQLVRRAHEFGMDAEIRHADFAGAVAYKAAALKRVAGDGPSDGGLSLLGAAFYPTHARFEDAHTLRIGAEVVTGRKILIATGTVPHIPPVPGLPETGFITNREAVDLETLPRRLIVLGGGPIGVEFAQVFRRFGSEVTVVEVGRTILPREDEEISAWAAQFLRDEGIQILTEARAISAQRLDHGRGKQLRVLQEDREQTLECDEILVATGRQSAVEGLQIEAAGVHIDERSVPVDRSLRTNVPHILAAGDVTGGYLFTHVASYEGKLAAVNAFADRPEPFDQRVVPRCTYTDPEVASIGLTEREAREQTEEIAIHTFQFADLDRAILHGEPRGLVKLVVDPRDGLILGAHLAGPDASSMIAELAICMKHHLPIKAIADTMHAYPSFPEAVEAAALNSPNSR